MGEKHVLYSGTASVDEVLYAIVRFVRDSGQDVVRFSNDAGTDAIWNGTAFVNASTITSASTLSGAGSYLVIEAINTMPGGERWQVKVTKSTNSILVQGACTKSSGTVKWTNAGAAFSTSQVRTGAPTWNDGNQPPATASTFCSVSDLDQYDQHQFDGQAQTMVSYAYFRVMIRDSGAVEGNKFAEAFRIGGYKPMEPHLDLNPWCLLTRIPKATAAVNSWGYATVGASLLSRAPLEDAQTTLDLTSTGYAKLTGDNNLIATGQTQLTRGGKWASAPLFLLGLTGSDVLGTFGRYDMMTGSEDRTDGSTDANNEYMNVNDLHLRWKP